MLDGSFFIECDCGSDEHTLRFILDKEDPCLYVNVYLDLYAGLFKRVWFALKYILKMDSKYGHFGSFTMSGTENAYKLKEAVDTFIDMCETSEQEANAGDRTK